MSRSLVIVESPTKARTLKKFLGDDFIVESSVGHIRDLPASASEIPEKFKKEKWARIGVDVDNDFQPLYVVSSEKKRVITDLKKKLKEVDELLLATDEDREGEAISWHLAEVLKPKVPTKRMVFHEITKDAILEALKQTREIDQNMVEAQEARRIIDRLYGYELSPLLWRKIAPRLSAGRVQSVAIRMVVEREQERMRFQAAEYWDISATLKTQKDQGFAARVVAVEGRRPAGGKDFDPDTGKLKPPKKAGDPGPILLDGDGARQLCEQLKGQNLKIISVEEKPFKRSPAPPFTTSTLQQEGGRKLKFDARRTMRAAQRLYEMGMITYMRTDSVALSPEALRGTRDAVADMYGKEFLPEKPREFRNKVKNAQEAHEAVRPAGESFPPPSEIRGKVGPDELKLYELIWKRTMACQMAEARGRRMVVRFRGEADGREVLFQANGNTIDFPGFLRVYVEGSDDPEGQLGDREVILPPMAEGETVAAEELLPESHTTQPPARYTEASLVKALEESGIGRPSTYASIIDTIQRREYTFKKGTALVPTFTAFAVVKLMTGHFEKLVDQNFTANMEDVLDAIARGEEHSLPYLKSFYFGGEAAAAATAEHSKEEVARRAAGLRTLLEQGVAEIDPRDVCSIPLGPDNDGQEVTLRVGRYGPYLQRGDDKAPVPDGACPDELDQATLTQLLIEGARGPESMGQHPVTNEPVYLKKGRFGPYVQLGDPPEDGKTKPKMVSLLPGMAMDDMTFDIACRLLELPRNLGADENGVDIMAYNGRYGPYIKRGDDTRSLAEEDNLLEIGRDRALELLAQEKTRGRRAPAAPIKVFEKVEALEGVDIKLLKGRYGPYVSDGETNASLPRTMDDAEALTVDEAVQLILDRRAKGPSKKKRSKKKAAKKKAAKKKAAKKKATKKKTAKKKAAKKSEAGEDSAADATVDAAAAGTDGGES